MSEYVCVLMIGQNVPLWVGVGPLSGKGLRVIVSADVSILPKSVFVREGATSAAFEEMDLNAFIRTADPRKVRIVKRARTENERPIVIVAKHRTVTLLPTSVPCPSGELSDCVEREFGEDMSGSGGEGQENASVGSYGNVEPIVPVANDVVAETGSSRVKRSKKKRVISESEDTPAASHPPKKLRTDYGKTSGSATGGGDHTDSATGPALRTIGPSEMFVVLSNSSHHSSAKSADAEVDSLIRSVAPVMTVATTVTTSISVAATTTVTPTDVGKDKNVPTDSSIVRADGENGLLGLRVKCISWWQVVGDCRKRSEVRIWFALLVPMTYGETSTARSAIGSGLQYHGISKALLDLSACPNAVKYIINHADIQAVFYVPTTLNILHDKLFEFVTDSDRAVIANFKKQRLKKFEDQQEDDRHERQEKLKEFKDLMLGRSTHPLPPN
ncbi:hypothetical protein Tco_1438503 [Tanacetum coccineum]